MAQNLKELAESDEIPTEFITRKIQTLLKNGCQYANLNVESFFAMFYLTERVELLVI